MGTRHVAELFSAAYDGALSPAEQRRYDEHLATCTECAGDAEHFRQAIDATRALPKARMPQRVVLPATPPQPERRRVTVPAWLRRIPRIPRPALSPAWGAGALAAAGVIAAVIAVHGHLAGSSTLTTGSSASEAAGGFQADRGAAAPRGIGGGSSATGAGIGTCPLPLAVIPQPVTLSATQPQGFSHAAVSTVPQRPGEKLVLATTATKVSAGEQVLIYAALTSSGGQQRSAVIPCVTLHSQGALAMGGDSTTAGGAAGPPTASNSTFAGPAASTAQGTTLTPQQVEAFAPYSLLPPLAVASPTSAAVATLPLQVLQIPRDTPPGTVLQLIALVPSGLPSSGDQPAVEAVLTLEVS